MYHGGFKFIFSIDSLKFCLQIYCLCQILQAAKAGIYIGCYQITITVEHGISYVLDTIKFYSSGKFCANIQFRSLVLRISTIAIYGKIYVKSMCFLYKLYLNKLLTNMHYLGIIDGECYIHYYHVY